MAYEDTIEWKKAKIVALYPGWRIKVDRMPDKQVAAIYNRLLSINAFNKNEDPNFRQMSLFDDFGVKKVYPYPKRMKGVVQND